MATIKIMDELLANKIAAGEVVERCASVVKELVENSIDANATEIKVELIESGTKEIKVIDDGKGMDEEDAVIAFSRHATSKLHEEDDLYRINTLGFRGEALASIASVSEIVLKTSTGEIGTIINIEGGKIKSVLKSDARRGTTMIVRNLFYNTPARLKHMKSLYTELASITDYINKLAISHPDIRFVLTNNGTEILNTDGTNNLLKTIKSIYGIDVAKKMIEINGENDDYVVKGYIGIPEINRSNRNSMITVVNGRVVRNMDLNKVINDSYHSYKPDNRYPIIVLNINVDPSLIDVNIHPTKMDIKFSKFEELTLLIEKMIKEKITKKNLIPIVEVKNKIDYVKPVYEELTLDLNRMNDSEEYKEVLLNNDFIEEKELMYNENIIKEDTKTEKFPEIYPVGLVHGTYIICQNELGMYIVDQHAAKERINYEMYKEKLGNPTQNHVALLFPITIELSTSEFIIVKEKLSIMRNMSFEIDEFGINSLIIKSHPTWLPKNYEQQAIRKIIEVIINNEKEFSITKFNESIAIMLSCKMSIKANENITIEEMETLINDLRKCNNPFNCPHGRPTVIQYTKYDLEKLFKRSGF